MLGYVGHLAATGIARLWMANSSQSWRRLPRPADSPRAHAAGADPDRLLLIGAGMAVGYGVMTHDLALAGHLARQLSERTGRGAAVDVVADSDMTCADARAILAGVDLSRYDAVILTLGALEAFTLLPSRAWRRRFAAVLDQLAAQAPQGFRVFAIEAMVVSAVAHLPGPLRALVRRHNTRINAVTRELCEASPIARFVPFDGGGDSTVRTLIARATYAEWSALIVPVVHETLRLALPVEPDHDWDEPARQGAVDQLRAVSGAVAAQMLATARDLFGVTTASVNLIDGKVQRTIASSGGELREHPRSDAFCDLTIRRAGAFVVEDARSDPRVAHLSMAVSETVRFYAGYPIESPNGHRIGALCLMDPSPRRFHTQDAALLRDLALRVQAALWQSVGA